VQRLLLGKPGRQVVRDGDLRAPRSVQPCGLSSRAAGSSAHAGDVRVVFIGFAVRQQLDGLPSRRRPCTPRSTTSAGCPVTAARAADRRSVRSSRRRRCSRWIRCTRAAAPSRSQRRRGRPPCHPGGFGTTADGYGSDTPSPVKTGSGSAWRGLSRGIRIRPPPGSPNLSRVEIGPR